MALLFLGWQLTYLILEKVAWRSERAGGVVKGQSLPDTYR